MQYRVTADEMPALFQQNEQRRYERVVKAIRRTVMDKGPPIAVQMTQQGTARKRAPINLGHYLAAWQAKPLGAGAVLYNDSPYAIFIERGRRPRARMPPVKIIAQWLEQKMRGSVTSRRDRLKQAAGLAFVVARAIGKRGLPAHRVMARTRVRLGALVRDAVRGAINGQEEE